MNAKSIETRRDAGREILESIFVELDRLLAEGVGEEEAVALLLDQRFGEPMRALADEAEVELVAELIK